MGKNTIDQQVIIVNHHPALASPGHKSITTTVDLYGHLVPEASTCARDALDKAFGI